jgi:hypothetical protein
MTSSIYGFPSFKYLETMAHTKIQINHLNQALLLEALMLLPRRRRYSNAKSSRGGRVLLNTWINS